MSPVSKNQVTRTNKKRPKVAPSSHAVLPPRMGNREELALAIWLWKSLRCHELVSPGGPNRFPTEESCDMGDRSLDMARRCGVSAEYHTLLFSLRLVRATLTPME